MIIRQVGENVQPQIAEHHRIKIEAGEIAEAEPAKGEKQRYERIRRNHDSGDVQSSRVVKQVIGGGVDGRSVVPVGGVNQGQTANDDMKKGQQRQPVALRRQQVIIGHV